MDIEAKVSAHYSTDNIVQMIQDGLRKLGKDPAHLSHDDLAMADEFHIGGRPATEAFAANLEVTAGQHILDIGSGIGGSARYVAANFGCQVTGIDLTLEYCDAATELAAMVQMGDQVSFRQASALALPFDDGHFDGAYTIHVAMNIADKDGLYGEARRVLKTGAIFGLYDVMALDPEGPIFPAPWAEDKSTSAVITPDQVIRHLQAAGFEVLALSNRRHRAIAFFESLQKTAAAAEPPPLGVDKLMGPNAGEKIGNMRQALLAGRIAPVEIIARAK